MNLLSKLKHKYLSDLLLYSFLGCISYFILIKFSNVSIRLNEGVMQMQVFIAFLFLFNGVGMSIRYATERMKARSSSPQKNRRWFICSVIITVLALPLINYGLLVIAKLTLSHHHPFQIQRNGINMLFLVGLIEMVIIALSMSNHFYKDMASLYKKTKDLEQANLQARYTALQNQLNPHFLFNSLNVLIAEIEYNPANAVAFTRNLSDTYRYILISQDKKLVPLDEELRFLDTYMNLHRTRLGDCIHVEAELPDDIREDYIPPLTLQLLAENVIKHNVISMGRPMTITVSTLCQDEQHWLVVSNPIRPKQGVTKTGKGLENLSVRYQLACQQKIEITQTPESFTVKVPLIS